MKIKTVIIFLLIFAFSVPSLLWSYDTDPFECVLLLTSSQLAKSIYYPTNFDILDLNLSATTSVFSVLDYDTGHLNYDVLEKDESIGFSVGSNLTYTIFEPLGFNIAVSGLYIDSILENSEAAYDFRGGSMSFEVGIAFDTSGLIETIMRNRNPDSEILNQDDLDDFREKYSFISNIQGLVSVGYIGNLVFFDGSKNVGSDSYSMEGDGYIHAVYVAQQLGYKIDINDRVSITPAAYITEIFPKNEPEILLEQPDGSFENIYEFLTFGQFLTSMGFKIDIAFRKGYNIAVIVPVTESVIKLLNISFTFNFSNFGKDRE